MNRFLNNLNSLLIVKRLDKLFKNKGSNKFGEKKLLYLFIVLFFILVGRLFYLQVIQANYYQDRLISLFYSKSSLKAKRGNIFVKDKSGKDMKLTENMTLYNLYVDPYFIKDKNRLIKEILPYIYSHLCETNGLYDTTKVGCIRNLEKFTNTVIIPEYTNPLYISGDNSYLLEIEEYELGKQTVIDNFSTGDAYKMIEDRLNILIKNGYREQNYLGFFDNKDFLDYMNEKNYPYINIVGNYIYVIPSKVGNKKKTAEIIMQDLKEYGYYYNLENLRENLGFKELRYIRLIKGLNTKLGKDLITRKDELKDEKIDGVPILHGLGFEKYETRIYPYGTFLSNVIGYTDKDGKAFYGIEEYFDELLGGQDGELIGFSVPWIGQVGNNDSEIKEAIDGSDIYLTIDPSIQKEVEKKLRYYYNFLEADSLSIIIMDPYNGKIKASANYPTFDPNFYEEEYKLKQLKYEERKIIDDDTYYDIPVFILTGDSLKRSDFDERKDETYKKYIYKNLLGPQVFVDKNVSFPYEPGSVFKGFTVAIGLDSDEISLYDFYNDPGWVKIGPFKISNIDKKCTGKHNFLHAFGFSCNVGMVRIAQRVGKYVFYSYLKKFGFGELTNIELAKESTGTLPNINNLSMARFYNNTFGQGLLVTPIQLAMVYASLVNGGELIKPTIVEKIYDVEQNKFIENSKKVIRKVTKEQTSEYIKDALEYTIDYGDLPDLSIKGYSLGGKTGTSQIAFKGEYKEGEGWTNGSFTGIITKNNTKYLVVIQVRRPRQCQWGYCTAGLIFKDMAKFLLEYGGIES